MLGDGNFLAFTQPFFSFFPLTSVAKANARRTKGQQKVDPPSFTTVEVTTLVSRKNDLARLAKVLPASGEVEGIIDQLRDDSDIAAAVTGAAIAEARLEQLLRARLKSGSKDVMLSIFENRGPLSDFNSKILIAQALGVITTSMATELQILRAIRNAFAHAKRPLTFGVPEVEKKVRGSKLLAPIDQLPPPHASLTRGLPSTKGAYLLIVKILLIIFEAIEGHQGSADEAIGEALADHDKISSQPDGERP